MPVMRDRLERYVARLPERFQDVFYWADRELISNPDTLSEEFQLAAAVFDVYEGRAAERPEESP